MRTQSTSGKNKTAAGKAIAAAVAKNKSQAKGKAPKKTAGPDYRVCKEAMENPKVFAELARWGREEIKIAEKEMPG